MPPPLELVVHSEERSVVYLSGVWEVGLPYIAIEDIAVY
jgi:hypothetical protein